MQLLMKTGILGKVAGWNVLFTRNLNDWEIEPAMDVLRRLHKFSPIARKEDSLLWKSSKT